MPCDPSFLWLMFGAYFHWKYGRWWWSKLFSFPDLRGADAESASRSQPFFLGLDQGSFGKGLLMFARILEVLDLQQAKVGQPPPRFRGSDKIAPPKGRRWVWPVSACLFANFLATSCPFITGSRCLACLTSCLSQRSRDSRVWKSKENPTMSWSF